MRLGFVLATNLVAVINLLLLHGSAKGSTVPLTRCSPASHICEGRCPVMPPGVELPPGWGEEGGQGEEGVCLKDQETGVCVCWLRNIPSSTSEEQQHLQTLFRCEVVANGTVRHVMCLPPPPCFAPGSQKLGCMIVLQCPCSTVTGRGVRRLRLGHRLSHWEPVVAIVHRSKTPVSALAAEGKDGIAEKPQSDVREFSVKHLLFLLAFVVAPLLCWCLLTFFHEGKCRKKRRSPETEPMPTARVEEVVSGEAPVGSLASMPSPTAPKFESPPQYVEALDPSESCPLATDCGPPPSYEDAIRDQGWQVTAQCRIQEV